MTIAERHKFILDKLNSAGFVSVADLSKEMDVTTVTVRKDLKQLEDKGLLYRSHGSATPQSPYVNDLHVNEKKLVQVDEKAKIASMAVKMLTEGEAIIIGSGTTVVALAKAIPKDFKLTVLTSAMNVNMALIDHHDLDLIQLGGAVRKSSSSVVGHFAEEMLAHFACSKVFIGADGISPEFGITTAHMMEAHLNLKMIRSVQKTIVLADSSKFGRKGFGKICDIEDIDIVITDEGIPDAFKIQLEAKGIEVMIAR